MLISTRGRYALRVLLDLAEHIDDGYVSMKTVAERQGLSLKYIERIMPVLSKNKLVEGVHGKGGGYRLNRKPEEYTVGIPMNTPSGRFYGSQKEISHRFPALNVMPKNASEQICVKPFLCGKNSIK